MAHYILPCQDNSLTSILETHFKKTGCWLAAPLNLTLRWEWVGRGWNEKVWRQVDSSDHFTREPGLLSETCNRRETNLISKENMEALRHANACLDMWTLIHMCSPPHEQHTQIHRLVSDIAVNWCDLEEVTCQLFCTLYHFVR